MQIYTDMTKVKDKQALIKDIVDMRVNKFSSTQTIIDWLKSEYGLKDRRAYEILRQARQEIKRIYNEDNTEMLNEALGNLEKMLESSYIQGNLKMALEIRKEINKLLGIYRPEKLDITSGGDKITDIKIIRVNGDSES